jgi:squalene synthase HpnC
VAVAHLEPKDYVRAAAPEMTYSHCDALDYTRWLATRHYENFHIVTFLLPKKLHQDFYNVYAYCRWADDLGDEIGDPEESLRLLSWWREELEAMYRGRASHPVFVALRDTVGRYDIPIEPFERLIRAFEQDQTVTRYLTFEEVFEYCVNSANPVGRLVLYVCGYRDAERQQLSDYTCTALQLANFWQDVTVDLLKGRIYLPLALFEKYGYTESELRKHKFTPAFRAVMAEAVDVAQDLFDKGLPLVNLLDRHLALDIELFSRGGMRVLEKIRRQGYDVLKRRPYISKPERVGILLQCLPRLLPF